MWIINVSYDKNTKMVIWPPLSIGILSSIKINCGSSRGKIPSQVTSPSADKLLFRGAQASFMHSLRSLHLQRLVDNKMLPENVHYKLSKLKHCRRNFCFYQELPQLLYWANCLGIHSLIWIPGNDNDLLDNFSSLSLRLHIVVSWVCDIMHKIAVMIETMTEETEGNTTQPKHKLRKTVQ